MTLLDIITDALSEIGAYSPADGAVPAQDSALGMRKLFYILDQWAARKAYVYATTFAQFTLVAGLGPHLIGQGCAITKTALNGNVATYTGPNNFTPGQLVSITGTTNGTGAFNVTAQTVQSANGQQFTLSIIHANVGSAADSGTAYPSANGNVVPNFPVFSRPTRLDGGSIVLNTTPTNVDIPFTVRDEDWWNYQRVKTLKSNIPTDVWYNPTFPNGQLNFWPVPNFAYGVRLQIWGLLQSITNLTDVFQLPPGYANAIMLTLAVNLAPVFQLQVSPDTRANLAGAIKAIQSNNDKSPRISTMDSGQPTPGNKGSRADFDWESGRVV